jgi:beta-glucanase (GH16 family)
VFIRRLYLIDAPHAKRLASPRHRCCTPIDSNSFPSALLRRTLLPMRRAIIRTILLLAVATSAVGQNAAHSTKSKQVAKPTITTTAAQNGAEIVTILDSSASATLYYTLDGSTPTTRSLQYHAPFLVASKVKLSAIAVGSGKKASPVARKTFVPDIPSGTLVWSDEFSNTTGANAQPNPAIWAYDKGGGWWNNEKETYCDWGSNNSPCKASSPNGYVGTDGYLHIVAQQQSIGVYTSARLKTEGLLSIWYGRVEARIKLPEGQGLWPAFWLLRCLGCGEMDVMEHVNAEDSIWGALHMTNGELKQEFPGSTGQRFSASDWHVYGMIWKKGSILYYVDSNVYAKYSPSSLTGQSGAAWPFDSGNSAYVILNLAVGGDWPGCPDDSTPFPSQMLVDYVRAYTN